MSNTASVLWSHLSASKNWAHSDFECYFRHATEYFEGWKSSDAFQAALVEIKSNNAADVPTLVKSIGQAILEKSFPGQLNQPFYTAWEQSWLSEGGQLLRRWVLAGQPGDKETVALRAAILAKQLLDAAIETQKWWYADATKLGVEADLVSKVRMGLGDFHGEHRSVTSISTADGQAWILRPSSGELESLVSRLLDLCGLSQVMITSPTLTGLERSWFKYIPDSQGAVEATTSLMREAGALLTFGWAFRAVDFHRSNALVVSDSLILVDAETFFQPKLSIWNSENEKRWAESVLGVGVLPRKVGAGGKESIEVGLVLETPSPGGKTPFPRPIIYSNKHGEIKTSWDHNAPPIEDGLHLPKSQEGITALAEAFVEGANQCREAILRRQDDILALLGNSQFDDSNIATRVILTPTYRYAQVLRLMAHPLVISDEKASILAAATISKKGDPWMWPAEAMQLLGGDVPAFSCRFGGVTLTTIRGEKIPPELGGSQVCGELSAEQAVSLRLREELASREVWDQEVARIFAAFRARGAKLPISAKENAWKRDGIQSIFDRIIDSIGHNSDRVFGIDSLSVLVGEDFDRAWEPGACGDELYGGMAGILDFLLMVEPFDYPGLPELLEYCREAGIKWVKNKWKADETSRLGLWDGAGGVLRTLVRLHRGRTIPDLLKEAIARYSDAVLARYHDSSGKGERIYGDGEGLRELIRDAEVIGGTAGRIRFWIELAMHEDEYLADTAQLTIKKELKFLRSVLIAVRKSDGLDGDNRGYAHGVKQH